MKSDRLRDLIKNQTKNSVVSFEEYRLRYASERFLSRLDKSEYRENFIIKGGFLLGTIYNIEQRTTKDLDTLLKNISNETKHIQEILADICAIDLQDGVSFDLLELSTIQERREYTGLRASLKMYFDSDRGNIQFDLDIGVGDVVTPKAKLVNIPLIFNETRGSKETLTLLAYPVETILAEKTEIILSLGSYNTRMKDFYDIHLILNDPGKPSIDSLYRAFVNTWNARHNDAPIDTERFQDWFFVIDEIYENTHLKNAAWSNYAKDKPYANNLDFDGILKQFKLFVTELSHEYAKNS